MSVQCPIRCTQQLGSRNIFPFKLGYIQGVELPPCKMMIFKGEPYKDDDFMKAIGEVWNHNNEVCYTLTLIKLGRYM